MLVKELIVSLQNLDPMKVVNISCDSKMIGKYSVVLQSSHILEKVNEVQIAYSSPSK